MDRSEANLLQWHASYNTGHERFDREHVELMDLSNRILETMHAGQPRAAVRAAFSALIEATRRHFTSEELAMAKIGFTQAKEHTAAHRQLMQDITKFAAKAEADPANAASAHVFLADWLLEHILQSDKILVSEMPEMAAV